ncbi:MULTISPECIES: cytochrome P450 [Sorangium]|uniref:Cytochrome P450 n=1 Tax=Sorangium cellulosum TaxID=56 RepID=A0A4P2QXI5_SORCE|nr:MULTISPECIES: cytochrome P450 [Sorangium]AUX34263.1 cytochrome P450 [Sorangium cellulosum]WCQ93581.1 Mycinamicin IV hydroxylase/epoxidase [Sorangium sp. Soce836]
MSTDSSDQVLEYPFRAPNAVEPPEEWAKLRKGCPVAHVRLPSGDKAVLVTRYDDVRHVLSDPRFTRNLSQEGAARITANEGGSAFESEAAAEISTGEQHEKWRRFISRWFTVKRISAMQQSIEAMANQLIDEMVAKGAPADLVSELAFPLPVWVIAEILGISVDERDKLATWSNAMLTLTQFTQEEVDRAQAEFTEYLMGHIAKKRAQPGDDLLSDLIRAADQGEQISEKVLLLTAQGVLVAGHETTSNMIAKMVAMLLSDRKRWERLLAEPSLVRTAVEEALRFDANAGFGLPRFITEDIELSGTKVPSGTTIICNMAAANRDEKAFERADEMVLNRAPNPHIAFGAGGHSCVGQALARTELQTVLSVLLRRLPSLDLAALPQDLPRREGLLVGGIERLLVRW